MKVTKGKLKKGKVTGNSTSGSARSSTSTTPITAYTLFENSIERANNLIRIHEIAHGAKRARPPLFLSDALRAAIILSVSALDAFIRAFVIDRIVVKISSPSETLPERLISEIKDCLTHEHLIGAARQNDLSSRVEKALRERFDEQSFQGVSKITNAMQMLGHNDVFDFIAKGAKMNEEALKSGLGKYTKRRHAIAHRSDYDLTQNPPIETKIRKKDALECIKIVKVIAREIYKLR